MLMETSLLQDKIFSFMENLKILNKLFLGADFTHMLIIISTSPVVA